MNKYSFVLPAYKARFFKEAIDSILAQTYTDFELIIVNDASPEDLESIVNSYNDPRIRYYRNEQNIGGKDLVAQWNHCLEYAKGEYVILASDDDIYFPQYLEKMNALVERYPDVNVFRSRIQIINEEGEICDLESFLNEYSTTLEFVYAWMKGYVKSGIPFYLFKKSALESIGGFVNLPLAWFSDDATVISLSKAGVVSCPYILFSFRYSGESISTHCNDSNTLKQKLDATDIFYKWYENFLEKTEVSNHYDQFYRTIIIKGLESEKKIKQIQCTENSILQAIIFNSCRLLRCKIFSFRHLLHLIFHRL